MSEAETKKTPELRKVEYRDPRSLKPDPKNVRTHTPEQVAKIQAGIEEFGFYNPVLLDTAGFIIAGHARTLAAIGAKLAKIPVIEIAGLSPHQRQLLAIADNRIGLDAGWNENLLTTELERLAAEGADIRLAGFDPDEIASFGLQLDETDIKPKGKGHKVESVDVSRVADKFWISVRGPLPQQALALQRLQAVMAEIAGVEVELGTTPGVEMEGL